MPASKAQQRAVTKYVKNRYDRFGLTMPKGRLDEIKTAAAVLGESVNGFINRAIDRQMIRDDSGEALGESVDDLTTRIQSVPPGTLAAAEAAAKATEERTGDFIAQAIRGAIDVPIARLGAGAISLPPTTIKAAREAAEAAGEEFPAFVTRAVETQAQRDALSRKMKGGKANE